MKNMLLGRRSILSGMACAAGLWSTPTLANSALAREQRLTELTHPDLRPFLARIFEDERSLPPWSLESLPDKRRPRPPGPAPAIAAVPIQSTLVPGVKGQPDVRVWIVNGTVPGASQPAILHMHGGGMIAGDPQFDLAYLQGIARDVGCVIVTVQYRLAPEAKFKLSVEDNYAALRFVHENARDLGIDASRIGVMGESAGGGHAALLAQVARDRGEIPLKFQFLMYPMLDDRTGSSRNVPWPMGELIWTAESNRFGWGSFLGQPAGQRTVHPHSVPGRAEDLKGLPPAFIAVGTLDLFCLENMDYATRLNAAGVDTELHVIPGAFHAFDGIGLETGLGRWMRALKVDALRRGLAGYDA